MRVGSQDKPFINKELKDIRRSKQREYVKNGKSAKYKKLEANFTMKYKAAAKRFYKNQS
jgi:hypothetical protein